MTPDESSTSSQTPQTAPASSAADRGERTPGFLAQGPSGRREERSWLPLGVAVLVVLAVAAFLIVAGRHRRAAEQAITSATTPDPYAARITLGNLQMSQATNFAGGKVTYVDGQVANEGDRTVDGITVRITFKNDVGEPPQDSTMPISLIRTRDPYVDIEPVSAAPLKPGDEREFRLIFDHVTPNWNQQYPAIQVLRTHLR